MRQFYAIEVFSERAKIYGIRNKKTKRIYIGRSKNVEERIRNHLYAVRNGKHSNELMQKDFDAYGEKSFEFVEICDAEKRTFMFFDTVNRTYRNIVNMCGRHEISVYDSGKRFGKISSPTL